MHFVGDAKNLQKSEEIHLAAGFFPEGTEFLNTLRYIDVAEDKDINIAPE